MFTDTEFLSASEKAKVLNNWKLFVSSGFKRTRFTKALYKHLSLHCGFIAHYDINGFYAARFADAQGRARTLRQLGNEGRGYRGHEGYNDINLAMAECINLGDELADCKEQGRLEALSRLHAWADKLRVEHGMAIEIHAEPAA